MLLLRASTLAFAVAVVAAIGCGRSDSPTVTNLAPDRAREQPPRSEAPAQLKLPQHVQPLGDEDRQTDESRDSASALAGYEQVASDAARARILDLSATPSATSPDLIRQPAAASELVLAPPVVDSASAPSAPAPSAPVPSALRSEFVPVEMPPESSHVTEDRLPVLPPNPDYSEPVPRVPLLDGPQPTYTAANTPAEPSGGHFNSSAESEQPGQVPLPPADRAAMQPVVQRAAEMSNHAYRMAHRGMLFAARAELIQSLQFVAQALDVQQGTTEHAASLAAGVTALKEAQDFASQPGRMGAVVNVAEIAKGHRTPVLQGAEGVSPVVAQQQYFAFAQAQLALAAGNEPVASQALYRLGKIQMAMGQDVSETQGLQGPQAMVYYQAALATDGSNYLAANELGVLMARYGQLQDARRLLVHSISIQPHAEGWHNLSVVHRRLGETDLAQRADYERQLLAQRSSGLPAFDGNVAWVDPQTFAATSGSEVAGPDNVVRRTAAGPGRETAQTARQAAARGSASFGMKR